MDKSYVIITDSTADFEIGYHNPCIRILNTPVTADSKDYTDSAPCDFYKKQREIFEYNRKLRNHVKHPHDGFVPKGGIKSISTSSPPIGIIEDTIKEILESGKDAIYVTMSSTLSSTFALAARTAVEIVNCSGEYKNRAICIDSLTMSAAGSLLIRLAADACDTTEELVKYIYERRNDVEHLFVVEDCTAFRESGRISALELKMIDLLNIKPLMRFDFNKDGHREAFHVKRARSIRGAVDYMVSMLLDTIDDPICIVPYAENDAGANMLVNRIFAERPGLKIMFGPHYRMGPAVGVHLGYSAVGLIFMRKKGIYAGAEKHRAEQTPDTSYYGIQL